MKSLNVERKPLVLNSNNLITTLPSLYPSLQLILTMETMGTMEPGLVVGGVGVGLGFAAIMMSTLILVVVCILWRKTRKNLILLSRWTTLCVCV